MDKETLDQIIETGRDSNNKDYVIELFMEGRESLLQELYPLTIKLKKLDKDFCIDLLRTHIEFLTDMLGLATSYMTRESKQSITADQALLLASFNKIVDESKKEVAMICDEEL